MHYLLRRLAVVLGFQGAEHLPRLFPVFLLDVRGHRLDRGVEHRGVVGEAGERDDVGDHVGGQHEVAQRAEQDRLGLERRLGVAGDVVAGDRVLEEGHLAQGALDLRPEAGLDAFPIPFIGIVARVGLGVDVLRVVLNHAEDMVPARSWRNMAGSKPLAPSLSRSGGRFAIDPREFPIGPTERRHEGTR